VKIGSTDVELLNALQVQTADQCLYFNGPAAQSVVGRLVSKYDELRTSISAAAIQPATPVSSVNGPQRLRSYREVKAAFLR
jgi:hypothetical protein